MKKSEKINYKYLDILKLFSVIMVVSVHCNLFIDIDREVYYLINNCIFRVAVPMFLYCSGFFIAYKLEDSKYIKNYVFRIFILYCVYTLLNSPLIITELIASDHSFLMSILLFIRNFLFVGSYTQLWYLLGTIWGVLIIYVLCRLTKYNYFLILKISLVFLLFGIFTNSICPILDIDNITGFLNKVYLVIGTTRNGLFLCFPCIFLGVFSKRFVDFEKIDIKKSSFIVTCLFILWIIVEDIIYQSVYRVADFSFFSIICSFFVFLLVVRFSYKQGNNIKMVLNYKKLRNYITFTFGNHLLVYFFVLWVLSNLCISSTIIVFILVLVLNTIEFFVLYKFSEKYYFLNYLW